MIETIETARPGDGARLLAFQAECGAQPLSAHVPGRAVIGGEAVEEFDQVAAPSGIVSCLPRRVIVECGDVFIKPLGFLLADELVEHLGHLGGDGRWRTRSSCS